MNILLICRLENYMQLFYDNSISKNYKLRASKLKSVTPLSRKKNLIFNFKKENLNDYLSFDIKR